MCIRDRGTYETSTLAACSETVLVLEHQNPYLHLPTCECQTLDLSTLDTEPCQGGDATETGLTRKLQCFVQSTAFEENDELVALDSSINSNENIPPVSIIYG